MKLQKNIYLIFSFLLKDIQTEKQLIKTDTKYHTHSLHCTTNRLSIQKLKFHCLIKISSCLSIINNCYPSVQFNYNLIFVFFLQSNSFEYFINKCGSRNHPSIKHFTFFLKIFSRDAQEIFVVVVRFEMLIKYVPVFVQLLNSEQRTCTYQRSSRLLQFMITELMIVTQIKFNC